MQIEVPAAYNRVTSARQEVSLSVFFTLVSLVSICMFVTI